MSDVCLQHIENYWKTLTVNSNQVFNAGQPKDALDGYKDALYRAEVLNNHPEECIRLGVPFIQLYIISCNNLSNTYIEMKQLEEAEQMLKRSIYFLLHLAQHDIAGHDILQSELKRASLALTNFVDNHGDVEKQKQTLNLLRQEMMNSKLI